ncbi:MAG: glycosyltransferase family 2 protein [Nevskiaceae bacterium]
MGGPAGISIITAVHNRVGTIEHALASVREQTWKGVQHIVIDGGSTDGTLEVLRSHQAHLAALVSEPDHGIYDALNKGMALAMGDVVGLLHSDDFFSHNDVLRRIAEAFQDPSIDVSYGDLDYVSKSDERRVVRRWRSGRYSPRKLRFGWMPPHPTVFVRRRLLENLGAYDTSMPLGADFDFTLRYLLHAGERVAYLPEVLVKMRTGGASTPSMRTWVQNVKDNWRALRKYQAGGVATLVCNRLRKIPQFF